MQPSNINAVPPFGAPLKLACGRTLPRRAFLAPLEGVMSPEFIKAAEALALLEVWMTPFVSVSQGAAPSRGVLRKRFANFLAGEKPLVAQILGHDPESCALCAARMAENGVEFISLNFACPSGDVVRGGSGGALLKSPELALKIVEAAAKALAGRAALIVKLRSGWDSPAGMREILPKLRDAGASAAILHFRTVKEGYKKTPDAFARIAAAVTLAGTLPLIGNGDIRSPEDASAMVEATGCAGIAVARGFMADPFLLRRILRQAAPPLETGRKVFLDALRAAGCKGKASGNLFEIARAMYGAESSEFRSLLARKN